MHTARQYPQSASIQRFCYNSDLIIGNDAEWLAIPADTEQQRPPAARAVAADRLVASVRPQRQRDAHESARGPRGRHRWAVHMHRRAPPDHCEREFERREGRQRLELNAPQPDAVQLHGLAAGRPLVAPHPLSVRLHRLLCIWIWICICMHYLHLHYVLRTVSYHY